MHFSSPSDSAASANARTAPMIARCSSIISGISCLSRATSGRTSAMSGVTWAGGEAGQPAERRHRVFVLTQEMGMHDARDFARRLAQQPRHLAGVGEVGVQLFVFAAE